MLLVWAACVVRVTLGVGPMRDPQGHPAPVLHYLVGALTVMGLVAVWIIARGVMARAQTLPRGNAGRSDLSRAGEQPDRSSEGDPGSEIEV